ncbi:MAG: hypothetical protein JSR31_08690 [Nitrospira sp.]|nr:hypothetical protein [Nitrospira sp.]
MRRRSTVLPGAKSGVANLIRGTTQAWLGTRIDVSIHDPAPRGAGAITEVVKVSVANRLSCPVSAIRIIEGRVPDVGARNGLRES